MISGSVLILEYFYPLSRLKYGETGSSVAEMASLEFSLLLFPLMSDSDRQTLMLIS